MYVVGSSSRELSLLFCVLVLCPSTLAQDSSSILSGHVFDIQGAGIPGAIVKVKNTETGLDRQASCDATGYYRLVGLPPGHYEAQGEHKGFSRETRTSLVLTVAEELIANFRLTISPLAEQVFVSENGRVDITGSTSSGLVDGRKIRDLPLNGRDMAQLILLQPGVVNSRGSVQSANTGRGTRFSVSGARPSQNLFRLDGTTINDALNNTPGSAQGLLIGVETVQEFRVLTSNYSAEYGRVAGGVFLAVTKSGTNELHGSLFEFLRNDVLDARNFFDSEKPPFRRNQFGLTFGGPLARNRTFFFGSYEGLRERKGITRVSVVPDEAARQGVLPGQTPIVVDPRSAPILDLYPHANGRVLGDGTAEFAGTTKRRSNDDFFTVRVDHNFSASSSLFVRYLFDDSDQLLPRNYPEFPNAAVNRKQLATIEHRQILSGRLVNEARFGFNRSTPSELVPETDRTFQLISGRGVGEINVPGLSDIGTDRTNPKAFLMNNYQWADNLFFTQGRHSLKLGGSFERFQYNGLSESRTRGLLRFNSLADLLRFRVRDLQGATPDSDFVRGFRQSLTGLYVDDEFRFNRRLSLNYGLRYERVTTPHEVNDKVANLRNILDKAVTVGDPYFEPKHNIWAPRLGFALDASGDGKTSLRGGFGLFHDQPLFHIFRSPTFRSLPYVNRGRLTVVPFLPVDPARFSGVELATEALEFNLRPSYLMQYSLNLQRELGTSVLSLAYVGSRGVNLFGQGDTNIAFPQILPDGREFFPEGSRRRNPSFDIVRSTLQGFSSVYNGMTAGLSRRFSAGLQFQFAYTLGKSIDERSGTNGRLDYSNGQARALDPYNRRLDRGLSDFDVRHSFAANATYDLPFGRSRTGLLARLAGGWQVSAIAILNSGVPFSAHVLGDPDRDGTDENTARPNLIPGISLAPTGGSTPDLWFNPAAFAPPQVGFRGTAGRNILSGPGYQTFDLAILRNFRIDEKRSLQFRIETFNLLNKANFDLPGNTEDGEMLFIYTPASAGNPATFVPPASVGKIFSTVGDSREIQFALKFIF
jgi:hypothetical protein